MIEEESRVGEEAAKNCADRAGEQCEHELSAMRAKKNMPCAEELERICASFRALGEPSRTKILLALSEGEMCVYHITHAVDGNQSNVSHQLRILKDNRIVRARRDGKNVLYSIADEHVASILLMSRAHARCEEER